MSLVLLLSIWKWLQQLGGPGLIALGIADASLVPIPGSIDALTIVLAASNRDWWPYYAAMATIGTVIGSYITYRLGRKGGKEGLEKKIDHKRLEKIERKFDKGGIGVVVIPALMPPPMPFAAFVLAAGALNFPLKKFFVELLLGRGIRFFALAFLASIYGKSILGFLYRYYQPILYALLSLLAIGIIAGIWYWRKHRHDLQSERTNASKTKGAATKAVPHLPKDSAA